MGTATARLPGPDAVDQLERRLRERLHGEVRFDRGSRALYAADGSIYRQVPIGVVVPRDLDDVHETISACREAEAPVLARGAGTTAWQASAATSPSSSTSRNTSTACWRSTSGGGAHACSPAAYSTGCAAGPSCTR